MKGIRTQLIATALGVLAGTGLVQAQPSAHYVPGVEGLKGASLPPPGFYLRDYNVFYWADKARDLSPANPLYGVEPNTLVYGNVPRLIWITDLKLLGGNIGVDTLLPLQYTDLELKTPGGTKVFDDSTFGVGDLFGEVTWSTHLTQFDLSLGFGVWGPTGDFSPSNPTLAGQGYWTYMFTAGATWYIDSGKKWALSALNRYEINEEQGDTGITKGNAWTLEYGASYSLKPTIDVGVVGYYQMQTTLDQNSADDSLDHVAAIGPEISMFCTRLKLNTSLRYLYEFQAKDRLEGQTVTLTLTKVF